MQPPQHVLIIGKVWPEPGSSAAGSRMMQLIELFQNEEWKVTFASAASVSEYAVDLGQTGIDKANIKLNNASFDRFIKTLQPDIVIFDRFMTEEQYGWRVTEQCPDAIRILDTEDLHSLRAARHNAWKEGREFKQADLLSEDIAKREIASVYRSDLSLIISDFEMKILSNLFEVDKTLLVYLPFMLEEMDVTKVKKLTEFESRSGFVSIGNFLHEPNWNAVLWLKEEIWPLIRKQLPKAELSVYGAYPSQKVFQLHDADAGFLVKGRAESASEVFANAKVLLAPLRFGAGLKGKLVEAMQYGTPSVTTEIGAEGLKGGCDWSGLIRNDAESIASAAAELYENYDLWKRSQHNGFNIINRRFQKKRFGENFISRLLQIKSCLAEHRKKNFTGAMLMQHTSASTKFMSKWIEAKNKL